MEKGWFNRLFKMIEADGRSMLALSQDANFGRNYVQQMIKNNKEPGADHLARLLDILGPKAALFVFTGLELDDEDREFLKAISGMDPDLKKDALRLLLRVKGGEGQQEP